jgi:hypothetical protein
LELFSLAASVLVPTEAEAQVYMGDLCAAIHGNGSPGGPNELAYAAEGGGVGCGLVITHDGSISNPSQVVDYYADPINSGTHHNIPGYYPYGTTPFGMYGGVLACQITYYYNANTGGEIEASYCREGGFPSFSPEALWSQYYPTWGLLSSSG